MFRLTTSNRQQIIVSSQAKPPCSRGCIPDSKASKLIARANKANLQVSGSLCYLWSSPTPHARHFLPGGFGRLHPITLPA